MNSVLKKHSRLIKPGITITGRWHRNEYFIRRKLGEGAIGTVYLCEINGRYAALKVSDDAAAMTTEVNVLKALNKVQGDRLGPYLLDVDDWICNKRKETYSFYVMEYIEGASLLDFIQKNGTEWIGLLLVQILTDLEGLHEAGWVFGDLKLDNLLVNASPPRVRFLDVGGVTRVGRSIKEFTEFNDRGYWGLGTRKAEPTYDLFAVVMVILNIFYPKRFERTNDHAKRIAARIDRVPALKPYAPYLKRAIHGNYRTAKAMKRDIVITFRSNLQSTQDPTRTNRQMKRNKEKISFWIESAGLGIISLVYYVLSIII